MLIASGRIETGSRKTYSYSRLFMYSIRLYFVIQQSIGELNPFSGDLNEDRARIRLNPLGRPYAQPRRSRLTRRDILFSSPDRRYYLPFCPRNKSVLNDSAIFDLYRQLRSEYPADVIAFVKVTRTIRLSFPSPFSASLLCFSDT